MRAGLGWVFILFVAVRIRRKERPELDFHDELVSVR